MSDWILVRDLEVFCRVGVPDAERAVPQRLLVTLEMEADISRAAATDDLGATIDYGAVSRRIAEFARRGEWRLLERLASDLAEVVLREFGPRTVVVDVRKFVVPRAASVGVRIRRERT